MPPETSDLSHKYPGRATHVSFEEPLKIGNRKSKDWLVQTVMESDDWLYPIFNFLAGNGYTREVNETVVYSVTPNGVTYNMNIVHRENPADHQKTLEQLTQRCVR